MHPALLQVDHRPWPLPEQRWSWRQSWCDLLFAHWRIDSRALRTLIPEPLEIDEFDGSSWIGVVPFRMTGVMFRPFPDMPWISAFPELNLRLYVTHAGKPGVWFLSLDATNRLAVWAARKLFHLPYFHSDISIEESSNGFRYSSMRRGANVAFRANYLPTLEVYASTPGTLEHFLTERYCLYAQAPNGQLTRAEVHHAQWPLQRATAEIQQNDLHKPHQLTIQGPPETLHFARKIDVVVWSPEAL